MKKGILKYLCAALALAIALPLAACAGGVQNETTAPVTTASGAVGPEETNYDPLAHVEKKDLDGYVFKILTPTHDWAIVNMCCDDVSGDIIQDAIYTRQQDTEDRLNIKITEQIIQSGVAARLMTVAATSGEDAYDLALVPAYDALTLYKGGYVADQAQINTLNLENPWWEQSFNREVNMGNKRYVTFGNASLIFYSSFYIFVFNKDMITEYKLDDPYSLVESGDWTWDKAYSMMQIVATDNDNDGVYIPGKDILGLTGHINHSRNLIFSSGFPICERGSDGLLSFEGLSNNYIDAFAKFTDHFITSPYVAISGASDNKYSGYTGTSGIKNYISVFINGESLFLTTGTNEVLQIRETEIPYGIVVVPKYDKNQQRYITPVYSATAGFVIPVATGDTERSGLVLDTLGAYSYGNLVDKHISLVLHYRVSQDPTAIDMINRAYANGAIDTAMANNFGTCTNILNNLNVYGKTDITPTFAAIATKLKNDIKDAQDALD